MSISAVTVEAGGFVLAVTGAWGASGFGSFALDPDGAKRVALVATGPGFERAGGQAVAAPRSRTLVATKPLRRPWPDNGLLDETDNGNGTRTVRLALSERVHAGETVTASFAAGWRTGLGAEAPTVGNLSAAAVPLPIFRWAVPQGRTVSGSGVRLEIVGASHFPRHEGSSLHQAFAAVRFFATDGTNSVSQWVTGLTDSPLYGGGLRCWGADLDLSGLTDGQVTAHCEVYPWLGAMRSTEQGSIGPGHHIGSSMPFVVEPMISNRFVLDRTGARAGQQWLHLDPVNGTATAAAAMVKTSLAAAKAMTPATKPRNAITALQALYLANRTLAAANGKANETRSASGARIVVPAGVACAWGSGTVTSGLNANEAPVVILGDPDDPDPRANCLFESPVGSPPGQRITQFCYRNLTVRLGDGNFHITGAKAWIDNCTVEGKPGVEYGTSSFMNNLPAAGNYFLQLTGVRWWKTGSPLGVGANARAGLLRQVESHNQPAGGLCLVNLTKIQDGFYNSYNVDAIGLDAVSDVSDLVAWNIDARHCRAGLIGNWRRATGAASAASPDIRLRTLMVNVLVEREDSASTSPLIQIGENGYYTAQDCIFDGVTTVGDRFNFHNDPPVATDNLPATGNVRRNCWWDRHATKHDSFPTESGNRTGSWQLLYGVGTLGCVTNNRIDSNPGNFQHEYFGLQSFVQPTSPNPWRTDMGYALDRSKHSHLADRTGGGDYRPQATAQAYRRCGHAANVDRDLGGVARGALYSAGALEGDAVPAVVLLPADAAQAQRAEQGGLRWRGAAAAQDARHPHAAAAVGLVVPGPPASGAPSGGTPLVLRVTADFRTLRVDRD